MGLAAGGAGVAGIAAAAAAAGEIGVSVCVPMVASFVMTLVGAGVVSVTTPVSTILMTTFSFSGWTVTVDHHGEADHEY